VPTRFKELARAFGRDMPVDIITQDEIRAQARQVKAVIRTGDFTAYSNVMIVSGGGGRWYIEKP